MHRAFFERKRPVSLASLALVVALGAAPTLAACSTAMPLSQTSVYKGEAYASGNADYDDFFEAVASIKRDSADLEAAEKEAKDARKALADALGIEKVDTQKIAAKVRSRAKKLAADGVLLRLDLEGIDEDGKRSKKVSAKLDTGGAHVEGDARELVDELDKAVGAQSAFLSRYGKLPAQAKKLAEQQAELTPRVATDFTGVKDRARVAAELLAAKTVLDEARERTEKAITVATALLVDVRAALASAGGDASGDKEKPEKPSKADKADKGDKADKADKADDESTETKPKKKKKKKKGDDDE